MNQRKKILFIINPISGTRKKDIIPGLIEKFLVKEKFESEITFTKAQGHAKELALAAANKNYDYVIAVGGDGTINEVASGLLNSKTTLGIIPCGSGNGLARHLRIPLSTADAIKLIIEEKIMRIDAGLANERVFFCTAGIGFDAHIGKLFSTVKKRGFKTYIKTVIKEFFNYSPHHYIIRTNASEEEHQAFLITVANSGQYGNDAYIAPLADIQDGILELCIIRPFPKRNVFNLGLRLFSKTMHKSKFVEIRQVKEVEIRSKDSNCYHLDGESFEFDEVIKFKVVPGCINVLVR